MADGSKPAGRPQGRSSTHAGTSGRVLSVDNPIDKGYLCSKICMCNAGTKLKDRLGRQLKQRCTTVSIWDDEDKNQLVWRYKAEVGYSMKANPPAPLMSREQPNRASRFPLGRAMGDGLLKRQLEGRPQKGLLRIPDCVVLSVTGAELATMRAAGHIDWKRLMPIQSNIETVVEIKFDGDELKREQLTDYRLIAGGVDKFRLLEAGDCDCGHRRQGPASEPVRIPVTTPMKQESTGRWFHSAPSPVPAPQPVKPQYGPVMPRDQGIPIANYLKGAAIVAGTVLVGVIVVAAIPAEAASAAAAGLVMLLIGTRTANAASTNKKDESR